MTRIRRRQFIQLSAAAAAGCVLRPGSVQAQELERLSEDEQAAQALRYTHDASTVDPASRPNPAEDQTCGNCALLQGEEGGEWRPCQIFPGKLVNVNGWCSVWAPKA